MTVQSNDCSGIVALQFGGDELSGNVGASAVDLLVASGPHTAPGTGITTIEMPQDGCVRGLSVVLEDGTAKATTVAATIDGTEDTTAIISLGASTVLTGSAAFTHGDMTFKKDEGLGVSLKGAAGSSTMAQGVSAVLTVQFGRSNI